MTERRPGADLLAGDDEGPIDIMEERPRAPFHLYVITDRHGLRRGESLATAVVEILEAVPAGTTAIQLREKDLPEQELHAAAEELREVTADFGARLYVNGRADVAAAVGADGVHLGGDAPPAAAVAAAFPGLEVGLSCHTLADLDRAADSGATFVTYSPIFQTSKTSFRLGASGDLEPLPPHGIDGLLDAARRSRLPLVALGGIRYDNVGYVRAIDVRSVACIGAVFGAMDRGEAAQRILRVLRT